MNKQRSLLGDLVNAYKLVLIKEQLKIHGGSTSKVAKTLGVHRNSIVNFKRQIKKEKT